ncbi:MAG: T9SS type A sorting domain-containing protein, partial [Bacteroidota bacterium]
TGFDLHFGTGFGTGLTSLASLSSTATAAPPQSPFLIGQFDLRSAFILDQCSIELNIQNVHVIRTDGSTIPVGSVDRIWPSQCLPTVSRDDPFVDPSIVTLFPNPATELVYLEWDNLSVEYMEVYDLNGRLVSTPLAGEIDAVFSVKHLPKGVYLIHLQTDKGKLVKRLVVHG